MSETVLRDIPYTTLREDRNCYDLHLPQGDGPCPLIIYFYGGGLKKGKKDKNRLAPKAAEAGIAVAVADYRLMPDVSYPAFVEDAADAVEKAVQAMNAVPGETNFLKTLAQTTLNRVQ